MKFFFSPASVILFFHFIFFAVTSFSQKENPEYYQEKYIRYSDFIYKENIATALLYREGYELSNPVIQLNPEEKLKLSFDDFDAALKSYAVIFIHCNADWQPSELLTSEYINGVQQDYINDYKYSRNTLKKYIHYNYVFPNNNFSFTKSGNYVLLVFEDEDKENIVFTKRFMIHENNVNLSAEVKRASGIEDRMYKQEIDFTITYSAYQITNAYRDLKIFIQQNHRWDNVIAGLKPLFVKDNELIYDYGEENVFPGGNEFRHFDIKNFRFKTDRIDSVVFNSNETHIYLLRDDKISSRGYVGKPDINGKRLIRIDGNWDSEVDADYAWVHFSLSYSETLAKGNIYILGALSDWNFSNDFKMKYNYDKNKYETALYLKQGYYNYQYVLAEDEKSGGDAAFFEGSHAQTENDYTIFVYHRSMSDNYDRLIAVENFNSVRER